jgi:hypothetical protein
MEVLQWKQEWTGAGTASETVQAESDEEVTRRERFAEYWAFHQRQLKQTEPNLTLLPFMSANNLIAFDEPTAVTPVQRLSAMRMLRTAFENHFEVRVCLGFAFRACVGSPVTSCSGFEMQRMGWLRDLHFAPLWTSPKRLLLHPLELQAASAGAVLRAVRANDCQLFRR